MFRRGRKLYEKGDFSTPLRCARNDRTAWNLCVSPRQETICKGFPIQHGIEVLHSGRKLFAKGFLHGMRRKLSIAAGNYSRKVSYTA